MNAQDVTPGERRITLAAVTIVFLLAALDQTIVSTAMPRIIADLDGLALYSWVTTAYLLTSTVMVPIWGKLGDLHGRKSVLVAGILLFLIGSWLSGLAGEFGDLPLLGGGMVQLIVFRAIQGVGGGALFTTAFAIIAELYPPRERAKLGGLLGAVFGLSSAVGPLIGGYFTDHGAVELFGRAVAGWRWVFYLNLPLSALSLFLILAKMPRLEARANGRIDILGAVLIIASVVPFLLALSLGGHYVPWGSPVVMGLFAGSALGLALYVAAERRAADPILPLNLFGNRVFVLCNLAAFLVAMAFMSTVAFLPFLVQLGQGADATTSGLSILPLMAGLILSSIISGRLVTRLGRYKIFMVLGMSVTVLGVLLLSALKPGASGGDLAWRMAVLGVGLGPGQSLFNLAVQNAMPLNQVGVVTSSSQFFRQIGATIGVALFGTVLTARLNAGLGAAVPGVNVRSLQDVVPQIEGAASTLLPDFIQAIVTNAITDTFAVTLGVVGAALAVTFLIPELPLGDRTVGTSTPGRVRAPGWGAGRS